MPQVNKILFSKKAANRLAKIADYIYEQSKSEKTTFAYMQKLKDYMQDILLYFPEAGRKAPEFGQNIRKIAYQKYAILYRINLAKERIEIVNIYRDNLP